MVCPTACARLLPTSILANPYMQAKYHTCDNAYAPVRITRKSYLVTLYYEFFQLVMSLNICMRLLDKVIARKQTFLIDVFTAGMPSDIHNK